MGLDEEKSLLGDEIVTEKDEDSDPEDEEDEAEEPAGDNGDDEDEEEEEELEDPMDKIREGCNESSKCAKAKLELDTCNQRVSSRSNTEETCVQELFDFLECADHCVSHNLFHKLK